MNIKIRPAKKYSNVGFELRAGQVEKLNIWLAEVNARAVEVQLASPLPKLFPKTAFPYYGTIGGGITFSFTPTGVGLVCKVRESLTGEELDLSEYADW